MNKTVSIIVTLGLIIVMSFILTRDKESVQSVAIENGVQYITIAAGGGYYPDVTTAKAGMPTKLIMKTNGTFDCSSSLVIRSVGFQQILPQTGETEIDLGIPRVGEPIQGVCGMGMYSFVVNFI